MGQSGKKLVEKPLDWAVDQATNPINWVAPGMGTADELLLDGKVRDVGDQVWDTINPFKPDDPARSKNRSGIDLAPASAFEQELTKNLSGDYAGLRGLTDATGLGASDVTAGTQSQRDLANMLQQYAQGGFLPGQQDFATANQFAQSAFNPQQVAINQQFQQEALRANQLAAQLGRPANDPIIQAKLSQERMRAQERLGAQQAAFATDFAMQLPGQRLNYTAQAANLRSSLASQAMANRQALLSLGSQLQAGERDWRLQTGVRWGEAEQQEGGNAFWKGIGRIAGLAGTIATGGAALGWQPFAAAPAAQMPGMSVGQAMQQFAPPPPPMSFYQRQTPASMMQAFGGMAATGQMNQGYGY